MVDQARLPHATLDARSRGAKALKIELLLRLADRSQPIALLEIGTGSGGIAHYFANHPKLTCKVWAVDVLDQRVLSDGYSFKKVDGVELPFEDRSIDVVISNHVIEHVGAPAVQQAHLLEIARVLAPDGVGYLAVPNRWAMIEPHYGVPFLSWLPRPWRSPYLRLTRRGNIYDCEPLASSTLDQLVARSGLLSRPLEPEAVRIMLAQEDEKGAALELASRLPTDVLNFLSPLMPTLIRELRHP